jgi:hypothetical protein
VVIFTQFQNETDPGSVDKAKMRVIRAWCPPFFTHPAFLNISGAPDGVLTLVGFELKTKKILFNLGQVY